MSNSRGLRITVDQPEHGWISVELGFGEQNYKFYPSDVPCDSISELVNALLNTLQGYDEAMVHWNDEPVEHEFVFQTKAHQIDFLVFLINESAEGRTREPVFRVTGSAYEVVWPFWKALRDLESGQSKEEYEQQWCHPFPKREMVVLTQRIKELKPDAGRKAV